MVTILACNEMTFLDYYYYFFSFPQKTLNLKWKLQPSKGTFKKYAGFVDNNRRNIMQCTCESTSRFLRRGYTQKRPFSRHQHTKWGNGRTGKERKKHKIERRMVRNGCNFNVQFEIQSGGRGKCLMYNFIAKRFCDTKCFRLDSCNS